jgi:DNA-binding CsgD family transcriptional regulator
LNKNDNQIFYRTGERRAAFAQLTSSVARRPWLACGLALYWLWFNISFQSPMIFPSVLITEGFSLPTVAAPITVCLLVYLIFGNCFKRLNSLVRRRNYLVILAGLMLLGALANILWITLGWQFLLQGVPFLSYAGELSPLAIGCFCVGALLIGGVTSCLNIEWGRIFGELGPMQAILQNIVGYLSAALLSFVISLAPLQLTLVVSVLIPVPLIFCFRKTQQEFPRAQFFDHGLATSLNIPWKFLLTALLHGLSFGALLGLHSVLNSRIDFDITPFILISYVCAAVLLFVTVVTVRMDFNHLIYQVGFTLVAIGAFFIILFYPNLLAGSLLQYMGATYLHLMMWGLCAYLTKSFKLPADWLIAWSTSCFMLGQLGGIAMSSPLAQLGSAEAVPDLFLVILLVVLVASNLMLSNKNLRTGWGSASPSARELGSDDVALITELLTTRSSLTNREGEVLSFLLRGWNRRTISDELVISEETVKSHTRSIYRKLLVGSQQELIALYESRRQALDD